ncbi:uncharacterized protein [Chlorocebus sabaeus]|uniref:uncharacterized protein n=1 Tax=Chlorocebus sabaeus TaxID=60711 RepID=UPI003BF9B22B
MNGQLEGRIEWEKSNSPPPCFGEPHYCVLMASWVPCESHSPGPLKRRPTAVHKAIATQGLRAPSGDPQDLGWDLSKPLFLAGSPSTSDNASTDQGVAAQGTPDSCARPQVTEGGVQAALGGDQGQGECRPPGRGGPSPSDAARAASQAAPRLASLLAVLRDGPGCPGLWSCPALHASHLWLQGELRGPEFGEGGGVLWPWSWASQTSPGSRSGCSRAAVPGLSRGAWGGRHLAQPRGAAAGQVRAGHRALPEMRAWTAGPGLWLHLARERLMHYPGFASDVKLDKAPPHLESRTGGGKKNANPPLIAWAQPRPIWWAAGLRCFALSSGSCGRQKKYEEEEVGEGLPPCVAGRWGLTPKFQDLFKLSCENYSKYDKLIKVVADTL